MVSPWIVRPPAFAEDTSSTGVSRIVTVELLLMKSSRLLEMLRKNDQVMLRILVGYWQQYRRCPILPRGGRQPAVVNRRSPRRPSGSWVKSPHGLATVSGERHVNAHLEQSLGSPGKTDAPR